MFYLGKKYYQQRSEASLQDSLSADNVHVDRNSAVLHRLRILNEVVIFSTFYLASSQIYCTSSPLHLSYESEHKWFRA